MTSWRDKRVQDFEGNFRLQSQIRRKVWLFLESSLKQNTIYREDFAG